MRIHQTESDFAASRMTLPLGGTMLRHETEMEIALLAEIDSDVEIAPPVAEELLSGEEYGFFQKIRSPEYRRNWFCGRILTKRLISMERGRLGITGPLRWSDVSVKTRSGAGRGVRPVCFWKDRPIDRALSISHSGHLVLVCMAKRPGFAVGCDLVLRRSVTPSVVRTFFLPDEIQCDPDRGWAAKEAGYKTLGDGRPFRPRSWKVETLDRTKCRCVDGDSIERRETIVRTFRLREHIVALSTAKMHDHHETT